MTKTILIPGAGYPQIDAIEYCKSKGYKVAGCSYTSGDPGEHLLDAFKLVDIKDADGMTEWAAECGAILIYTAGSDLAMPTVMEASERLGLPHFISYETAQICHAKHRMRQTLGQDFAGNVPFGVYASLEDALGFTDFPGMMKPVDSQGQRGCFRVDSAEDIRENFAVSLDYSIEGKVIIEKFITGEEISVNGYMAGGELVFAGSCAPDVAEAGNYGRTVLQPDHDWGGRTSLYDRDRAPARRLPHVAADQIQLRRGSAGLVFPSSGRRRMAGQCRESSSCGICNGRLPAHIHERRNRQHRRQIRF